MLIPYGNFAGFFFLVILLKVAIEINIYATFDFQSLGYLENKGP